MEPKIFRYLKFLVLIENGSFNIFEDREINEIKVDPMMKEMGES